MSISDLYSSGFRERNKSHFAAIVRVALSDGEISTEEQAFLTRLADNLDVSG
ncbi:MAG: TerB family tellurite resistance protein, partial [Bacteroidota bacterium]